MDFTAIIAEFNPLTKGHEHLLNQAKKMFPETKILVIMSGNFVQRGEPSVLNKYTRANHAVLCGADLVIELPCIYSLSSAQDFAYGAITILNQIPNVKNLIFGSEDGNIDALINEKDNLINETIETKKQIKKNLNSGNSYAKSVIESSSILSSPNNLLGTMYLVALHKLNSKIKPYTIKRLNNYNSLSLNEMPSATAIRNSIKNNSNLTGLVPEQTLCDYNKLEPINYDILFSLLSYKLLTTPASELNNINGISEGLENKLIKENITATNYEQLIEKLISKRYFKNKIQRILLNALLDITKQDVATLKQNSYIKILAVKNEDKNKILKSLSSACCPVISSKKDILKYNTEIQNLIEKDILASNLYSLLTSSNKNQDFLKKI